MKHDGGIWEWVVALVVFMVVALFATTANAAEEMSVVWKDGLQFTTSDGLTTMHIGGRIFNDWGWFPADEDSQVSTEDGTEFRRARIYMKGSFKGGIFYKSQIDFGAEEIGFKDMYMGLKGIPVVGKFFVGQMKEPYSLEEITSSNYITMMERSTVAIFDSERNTGFMLQNLWSEEQLLVSAGIFRDTNENGSGSGDGKYNYSARVTGLPWENKEHRRLLHLGVSGSYRSTLDGTLSYSARPSSHFAEKMFSTQEVEADHFTLGALESAVVVGPFSFDAEYKWSRVEPKGSSDRPTVWGYYVSGSWFLTGESRPYKHSSGAFNRVKPHRPLGVGPGAWEFALRFSHLDGTELEGNKMDDYVVGVNWYANNNARVMLNYVYADANENGTFSGLQTRFMVYF